MTAKLSITSRLLLICLSLAALTIISYWGVTKCGFVNFDDDAYVTLNPHVSGGISPQSVKWAFTAMHSGNWHPITWISHMLDCRFYGFKPMGHHLTNLFLHIANTILLLLILKRMTGALWKSAFVAALFAIHPLHVESVAWIAERKDVLSTFFWLTTILAYIHYSTRPNIKRYLLVLISFALGLMSKPMLVTLPLVLLLLDYWPLKRIYSSAFRFPLSTLPDKLPLLALVLISCAVTFVAQGRGGAVVSMESFPLGVRIANACVSYISYILKMLWPAKLAVYYQHPGNTLPVWQVVGSVLAILGLTVLAIRAWRSHPYITMGIAWYSITLIPVIGIIQVGGQAMADRYTYVPMIGLFIAIAWGIPALFERRLGVMRPIMTAGAVTIIIVLCVCTAKQVKYWRNSITLFEHAIAVTGPNYVVDDNLGQALAQMGRGREAVRHFRRALAINPNDVEAHVNMGISLSLEHRYKEAIEHYATALKLKPNHCKAHYNLAGVLFRQDKPKAAAYHFRKAIESGPSFADAHVGLGSALLTMGKRDEAADHFQEALRLGSKDPIIHFHLGAILEEQGNVQDAVRHYREALRLDPHRWDAANNLAWIFATQSDPAYRNPREAIRLSEMSCETTGYTEPQLLDTLAVAYASAGRYNNAASAARKALKLTLSTKHYEAANEIRRRLRTYQARRNSELRVTSYE